ncbi:Protein bric-a-brac 2, partial [Eumeta japonica]
MPEQFSLRWNDFHANLSHAFHALLEGQDMVDVTLAAGGHYVHAHKLILSVCSPYFKELFKMNPCEHPIVILKDVAHSELRQLLQFMYRGEVHVRRQELSGFLHTTELLQVKGLTTGRERSESPNLVTEKDNCLKQDERPTSETLSDWGTGEEPALVEDEEPGRSPLKRLLKGTLPKNNAQKKRRPVQDGSPIVDKMEKVEYTSDNDQLTDCDSDLYHSVLEIPEAGKEGIIKQE